MSLNPLQQLIHAHHELTSHGAPRRHNPHDFEVVRGIDRMGVVSCGFVWAWHTVIGPLTLSMYQLSTAIE